MKTLPNPLRWTGPSLAMLPFVLAAAGCGPTMKAESYWGPGMQFDETTHSYAWTVDSQQTTGKGRPANPRADELIRQSIEKHLALKGYGKAGTGKPDFLINYWVGRRERGDAMRTGEFTDFSEGTLAVFAYNPATSKLIWRGIVREAMDDTLPPDKQVETLDQAVKILLDQVPSRKTRK